MSCRLLPKRGATVALWLILATVSSAGCVPAPDEALSRVLTALESGDVETAVAGFTSESEPVVRAWLALGAQGAEALAAPSRGSGAVVLGYDVRSIRGRDGSAEDVAFVRAQGAAGMVHVPMVRQHGRWRVDLLRLARAKAPRTLGGWTVDDRPAEVLE